MEIKRTKGKKIGVLILILAIVVGLLPQMIMQVQAEENVYGVLKSDNKIYETNADNTKTDGLEITNRKTVTHLFAAADVETITSGRFRDFPNLMEVNLSDVTKIDDYAFFDCVGLTTANFPEVAAIDEHAFQNCRALNTISLPKVTMISNHAFSRCSQLETIIFPEIVTVDDFVFEDCSKIKMVSFPKATTIGKWAFLRCEELTTVELPEVTTLSKGGFASCFKFENFTVGLVPPSVEERVFSKCPCTNLMILGGNTPEAVKVYDDADIISPQGYWYGWALPYALTVNNGKIKEATVSGNYRTGTEVTITANEPKAGQRFKDWTAPDGEFVNPKAQETTFTMPGNAVEVSANYEIIPVTSITFDANKGVGEMMSQQISEGSPQALNENKFTRKGYSFKNWNTEKTGNGTAYANKAEFSAGLTTTNISLYAQWTKNTYMISGRVVDGNGNKLSGADVELKKGDTTIAPTVKTDKNGGFTINNVPNGSYSLVVRKDGVVITVPVTINNANISLEKAIVLSQTANPVPSKNVTSNPKTGNTSSILLTVLVIMGLILLGLYINKKRRQQD